MKHLGIFSITFLWLGLIFMIRKWKGNVSMTFSQHAAQTKAAQLYYLLLFAVVLPVFALFMYGWFIPEHKLSILFGISTSIGLIGNLIAAIIPETEGTKVRIHRLAAFLMAATLIPIDVLIAASASFPWIVRLIAVTAATYQTIGVIILTPRRGFHPNLLPLQASYVAVFHITILAATYVR